MKVGIYTYEQYHAQRVGTIGSSRIRGKWIAENWPEAELLKIGKKYDAIIFQKVYFKRFMTAFDGVKILDLCDPDWLDGKPVLEHIELADAVTVSSIGLQVYLQKMTDKPIFYIPDRVDMKDIDYRYKVHEGTATGVVWYGYHNNQEVLNSAIATLKRLGLTLTVISDLPYYPTKSIDTIDNDWIVHNIKNIKYDQETIYEEIIAGGDMVLNPQPKSGKYKFKSFNKTFIAWALGMPVAKDSDDVERFMDQDARLVEAGLRTKEVKEKWTIEKSVEEYKKVINSVLKSKE